MRHKTLQNAEIPRSATGWVSSIVGLCLVLIFTPNLLAHDPPEEYYGRNISVTIEPGFVRVHYRLELSQISLFSLPRSDTHIQIGAVKGRPALESACMERFKVLIPDQIVAFLNNKPLTWAIEKTSIETNPRDSTHFHVHLRSNWMLMDGTNQFEITDENFKNAPGMYRLKFDAGKEIQFGDNVDEPREWSGKGIPDEKYRKGSVDFRVVKSVVENQNLATPVENEAPPQPQPQPPWWEHLFSDNLTALMNSNYGVGLLMLLALFHGAGHSLMPGHGKTMVAAYLVGERGTPWHAVLLGIVTTITHTIAVIVIAILIRYWLPKDSEKAVQNLLQFACGLTMVVIGLWLFLQRLAGRSDHVHLFDLGHGHAHGDAPVSIGNAGTVRLIMLGIVGGIVPCWGAITWVLGCIATGQFSLALPIVLAFSLGLASVLILIGLTVVYSGRMGQRQWGERRWFKYVFNERTIRALPIAGAAVLTAIGLFFTATSGLGAK
jgi:nickel/cobalt exporter